MDPRLSELIADYLASVSSAVKLLEEAGIGRPRSNTEWASNDMPQSGVLVGNVKYFKHGHGCAVHLDGGVVDFDFGEQGEINGFSSSRLAGFVERHIEEYGFDSKKELESCFSSEVEAGSIVYSSYILHYLRKGSA